MEKFFVNGKKERMMKRMISILLVITLLMTGTGIEGFFVKAQASGGYVTLYLKDDTAEHWLGNDNAVFELVDNTSGHDHYTMTKVDSVTWSCRVPAGTYNVTFNRLSPGDGSQWNSWSAGGRGSNVNNPSTWHSTYHATVAEHGYWDGTAAADDHYFHEGDIVYLDFYSFTDNSGNDLWEMSNAIFYVNFTGYSKADNGNQDINISSADRTKYSPVLLTDEIETQVFKYVVTAADEGAVSLRFFRGNAEYLWNNSVVLNYSDYQNGNNCVKVQGWDDTGYVCPYVPRRHTTQIDSVDLSVTGDRKVYRKIEIDASVTGETQYLSQEDTVISIVKTDNEGNVTEPEEGEVFFIIDEENSEWNHRELVFTEEGNYRITVTVTDGYDEFSNETQIIIAGDTPPTAAFEIECGETGRTEVENVFVRDSDGVLTLSAVDHSVAEAGDTISERNYTLYYDADNDGVFDEEEIVEAKTGNDTSASYEIRNVGKYRINLEVKKTVSDSILSLIQGAGNGLSLSSSTYRDFEVDNLAPRSAMSIEKAKSADILVTVADTGEDRKEEIAAATANLKETLESLGIETSVTTANEGNSEVITEFNWAEYDHPNYWDVYAMAYLPHHIRYNNGTVDIFGYPGDPYND